MAEQIPDLKARREALGWTIGDVARFSNTSDQTVQQLENGNGAGPEEVARIEGCLAQDVEAPKRKIREQQGHEHRVPAKDPEAPRARNH